MGQSFGPFSLIFQESLLQFGSGRQGSNLAVVGTGRPGHRSFLDGQTAEYAHLRCFRRPVERCFGMQFTGSPAFSAILECTLVAKAELAVFSAGSTAFGTNFAKAKSLG